MHGTIVKSTGSWYYVLGEDGKVVPCKMKGKLRLKGYKTTNPIAVGDEVHYELEPDGRGVINARDDRRNYVIRKATNLSRQEHVIATNLDASALVVTLFAPKVSYGFIDRFLLTCEAYDVPAWLILNKMDLYEGTDFLQELVAECSAIYEPLGYPVLLASATTGQGIAEIQERLVGKRTLFSGHSGVGKSTLINAIAPEMALRTGDISEYSMKGKHTTTFSEMFALPAGGFIIDTPGIKELGIVDIENQEVSHFFPEMKPLIPACKFHNCIHISEPMCAVRNAVEAGAIAPSRYMSYLSILANEDQYN